MVGKGWRDACEALALEELADGTTVFGKVPDDCSALTTTVGHNRTHLAGFKTKVRVIYI